MRCAHLGVAAERAQAARVGEERGGGGGVVREEVLRQAEVHDVNQLRRRHARCRGGRGGGALAVTHKRRVGAGRRRALWKKIPAVVGGQLRRKRMAKRSYAPCWRLCAAPSLKPPECSCGRAALAAPARATGTRSQGCLGALGPARTLRTAAPAAPGSSVRRRSRAGAARCCTRRACPAQLL